MLQDLPENQKPPERLNDKMGKFYIPLTYIREQPEQVAIMLRGVVVVLAQTMFAYDAVEYHGMHPQFATAPMGRDIPEYKCVVQKIPCIDEDEEFEYVVRWEQIGPDGFTASEASGESDDGGIKVSSVAISKEVN